MWPSIGQSVTSVGHKCWSECHKCHWWPGVSPSDPGVRLVSPVWPLSLSLTLSDLWLPPSVLHNSDLRDSREYTQKQVSGERIFTRQNRRRFGKIRLKNACYDTAHTTYLQAICVHNDVSRIWAVSMSPHWTHCCCMWCFTLQSLPAAKPDPDRRGRAGSCNVIKLNTVSHIENVSSKQDRMSFINALEIEIDQCRHCHFDWCCWLSWG